MKLPKNMLTPLPSSGAINTGLMRNKIDCKALPAPDESNTLRDERFVAPRTPIEEQMAAIQKWIDREDRR